MLKKKNCISSHVSIFHYSIDSKIVYNKITEFISKKNLNDEFMFFALLSVMICVIICCWLFACWLFIHEQRNDVIQRCKKYRIVKDRVTGTQLFVAMNDDFAIIL